MMVRFILNSEIALVFGAAVSVLLGMLFERSLAMSAFFLIGGLAGAHWVGQTSQRHALLKAGVKLGIVQGIVIAATGVIAVRPDASDSATLLTQVAGGLVGGTLAGLVVLAAAPLVELVFAYTTDVKLMELANMNHPLLKEMVIRASGTYNHSILVATLAETAAEAIHANPILAKVGGLYQDIGKIGKPHYFIENQREGENPHDRLAPRMSGLVVLSHVKEGVELARRHKLGDRVVDIIQQHHGKSVIKFFYHRAKEMEDPTMESVSEEDFRYPGPKPQTREAAIVMLADVVEATSRSLRDPAPARIATLVEESIDNAFKEGQLDECELTLRDLYAIGQAFQKVLNGWFHARIEYPDAGTEGDRRKGDPGSGAKQPKDAAPPGGKDPRPGKESSKVVKIH
jgi:putative nucleotidyltransferase with HDIG domain